MRTTSMFLILGLMLMATLNSEAQQNKAIRLLPAPIPTSCCFNFIHFAIPVDKVKSAERTSSFCSNKAVMVTTVNGNMFCVKPEETWLQNIAITYYHY